MAPLSASTVDVYDGDGECVVRPFGGVDIANAGEFASSGIAALAEHEPGTVVLDLSDLTFIDSAGIGALIAIRNEAEHAGWMLRLRNSPDGMTDVLTTLGIADLFAYECGTVRV